MKISRILICLLFAGTVFAQSQTIPCTLSNGGVCSTSRNDESRDQPITNCDPVKGDCFMVQGLSAFTALAVFSDRGPSVEIITTEHGKASGLLRIKDADGKMLITVHEDGTITTDNGFKADDAAKVFWRALAVNYRPVCDRMYPPAGRVINVPAK